MKACPYCAEQIQDAAIRCRFCGSNLQVAQAPPTRTCPACAEAIPASSAICPLCNTNLRAAPPATPAQVHAVASAQGAPVPSSAAPVPAAPIPVPAVPAPAPTVVVVPASPIPAPVRQVDTSAQIRNLVGIVVLLGLLGVLVLFGLPCVGGMLLSGGGSTYAGASNIVIASAESQDCSGLLDYCIRGQCTVLNAGDASGGASVEVSLQEAGGVPSIHTEYVNLLPGERKTVSHDFVEARLLADNAQVLCTVQ